MKAHLIRFFFCLAVSLLSSCTINTSTRVADCGHVYECVRLDGAAWRCGDALYVRGCCGQYYRRPELVQGAISSDMLGAFIRVPETEESAPRIYKVDDTGIHFLTLRTLNPGWNVCTNEMLLSPAELPSDAVSADYSGVKTAVLPTGQYEITWNACWAYPLAGACLVAVDIPCAIFSMFYFCLTSPLIEMGIDPYPDW